MDPLIVLFGFGVGLLVGTTGMGGGSLMTPLLIIVFGIKPVLAIGTDLVYGAVTKTVGGWRHLRMGTVHMGTSMWLAVGSVPGAIGGVLALNTLRGAYGGKSFDNLVLILVACALVLTSVAVLGRALLVKRVAELEREDFALTRRDHAVAVVTGLVIGFVLSVTSAGSGSLIAVVLIVWYRLTPRRVVGTDVFHAAILLWVAGLAHLLDGNVDLGLAANICIGSLPGVWLGARYSERLPDEGLRPTLGIVLLASGLALLSKAGMSISPVAIVGGPLAVAALAYAIHRARSAPLVGPTPEST
ncbi:MAG TPA: sulfite exporter TauE/SafE family protein [Solirubrobacteraceae bacterium]|nr:sulfite exporter TauE/SafE family protein [Solirubrobacteraceae bacterium]